MTRGKDPNGGLKYQVNWFAIDQLNDLGITSIKLSYINPSDEQLEDIKESCMAWMKANDFILVPNPEYRVKYNKRHRLVEFGIQYHHSIGDKL